MPLTSSYPGCAQFDQFQLDLKSGVLQRSGVRVPVQTQPLQVLRLLLQAEGKVVTREELRKVLWPEDTFVDFELGVNTAVKKLRQALADPADRPKFIETLPKIGYRFLAPVQWVTEDGQEGLTPKVQGSAPSNGVGVTSVPENHGRAAHVVDLERRSAVTKKWVWLENRPTSGSESAAKTKSLHALAFLGAVILLTAGGLWIFKRREAPAVPQQRTLTRITFDEGLQNEPTWSPDGRYIAYSSDRGGKFDIWVQQVSGGDPVQVTKGPGHHWQPDWSPDGKYIAYRSEEGDGGIYVAPALGGAGLERKIAAFGYHPQWAPDSLQVLFQAGFTEIPGWGHFYIAQLDGSAPREVLAEFFAQNKLWAASAAWHPDGKRVTVWAPDLSPTPSFWMVPIAGGPGIKLEIPPEIQRLLKQASGEAVAGQQQGDYSFSWSPAGDAIYFERVYSGARNIWKMTVDPGTLRASGIDRLTTGPGLDAAAAV